MAIRLKPLHEQTLVITGASSGIGLATARLAAHRGARVVLASRNGAALEQVVEEIRARGGEAAGTAADVSQMAQMEQLAAFASETFGGFDTWVNNAGLSIYGRLERVPLADARRLFDTNYWGVVHGSLVALQHLRDRGGALINIGSVLSDRAIPLQGHYSASKHAVKGFTDALRSELRRDDVPVVVTLIKPAAIDTPYVDHARNYLDVEPLNPPPVYHPRVVARAILACAVRPHREVVVGGGGRMLSSLAAVPRLADLYVERVVYDQQRTDHARPPDRQDSLERPADPEGRERGRYPGRVMRTSAYTAVVLRQGLTAAGLAALGTAWALLRRGRR